MTSRLAQNSVVISGSSSGSATIAAPATAGTPTLTLPTSSGTLALTSQIPAAGVTSLNGQTGAITNTSTNTIGSYFVGGNLSGGNVAIQYGNTVAGSVLRTFSTGITSNAQTPFAVFNNLTFTVNPSLSGTWRAMATSRSSTADKSGNYSIGPNIWVRVS